MLGEGRLEPRHAPTTCRSRTTSTTRRTRTRRSTSRPTATSANGTEGPSKINVLNAEPVQHADLEQAERVPHHLLARGPSALGDAVDHSRRHRHRVRTVVPLRQPVLPRAERRRAGQALPGQGQLLDRQRHAHDQGRRRVAAHEQRPGLPRLLRGPVPVRQRDRLPSLHVARGAGRIRAEHDRLLERHATSRLPRRCPAGIDRPAADRCSSICRAAALTASRAMRPARPTSTTTSSRCSSRTSGRPGNGLTLDYGLRWDAQMMPDTVDPKTTAYRPVPRTTRGFRPTGRFRINGSSSSRASGSRGTSARTASRSCAAAPASTTRGRTC